MCTVSGGRPVEFCEDMHRKEGLVTHPYIYCSSCGRKASIQFARVASTKKFAIKEKSLFANKCIGGRHSSPDLFYTMMDLPLPVSPSVHCNPARVGSQACRLHAGASMRLARIEVRHHYDVDSS